jgi:hypothetical protein
VEHRTDTNRVGRRLTAGRHQGAPINVPTIHVDGCSSRSVGFMFVCWVSVQEVELITCKPGAQGGQEGGITAQPPLKVSFGLPPPLRGAHAHVF